MRKLAAENSVDLSSLKGTGVGGRIRKQDVLDAAKAAEEAAQQQAAPAAPAPAAQAPAPSAPSAPAASPKRGTTEKMSRLRKVIAQRMVESLQVSAQLTTVVEVDVTKIARLRTRAKSEFERREGTKLSFLPFFALAAVEALKAHPNVNASVEGDQITYHGQENLGVAVDTERGLLVPVIKNAGDLNIAGLARAIADLADRTRNNKITPDELGGGTFTLTNTGSRGALFDTPIINQPQVAILGTGAVVRRPVVVTDADGGETIAIRSMAYLALSYDHRIVDGADAARFLSTMKARLEEGSVRGLPGPLAAPARREPSGARKTMSQRVAITGASGMIGGALSTFLSGRGDEVVHLVRRPARTAAEISWDPEQRVLDPTALSGVDAVVHLAGVNVGDKRWTPSRKQEIFASRVDSTHTLAAALAEADHPIRLVSQSAVGYYGSDRGNEVLTEESESGHGFLAEVVRAWEAAAEPARSAGLPVAHSRTGIVLAAGLGGHGPAAEARPARPGRPARLR